MDATSYKSLQTMHVIDDQEHPHQHANVLAVVLLYCSMPPPFMAAAAPRGTADHHHALLLLLGLLLAGSLAELACGSLVSTGDFNRDFYVTWNPGYVNTSADGRTRTLMLHQGKGSAFASNDMFLFGQFDMKIKLIPGYSAGTVVAFYLASGQRNRDEIDLEFLGNVTGQPYLLQTNVYADGSDNREERISLWFDPAKDFHTYSIRWNLHQIVFMVDRVPIRVFRNHGDKGVPYPRWQPMALTAAAWNGDDWATRGGLDKVDWSKGPFVASFGAYGVDACVWKGNPSAAACGGGWWNGPGYAALTWGQRRLFRWVRRSHLVYDYCLDAARFPGGLPRECSFSKFS